MSSPDSSEQNRADTPPGEADETSPERVLRRHTVGEALSGAGFGDVLVVSHESAEQALTPARREIIETLSSHDVSSVRELADVLNRDPGNLTRDLKVLVAENVLRYVDEGRSKRPELKYDTVIAEPVVASDSPLPDSQ
jgi:DNA-binding transcriptional ArsR family regulator